MKKCSKAMLAISLGVVCRFISEKARKPLTWFEAVEQHQYNDVLHYINKGQNIELRNVRGRSALMIATYNNDYEMAKILIEAGANVNRQDDMLNTPFLYAAAEGYLPLVQLFTPTADTKVTNRFGGIGLIPASERGHYTTVKWLLEHTDSDVNHVNNLGWTALLEAILLGDGGVKQQQIVSLLLKHDANQNMPDKDGVTPIEHAEKLQFKEMVTLLEQKNSL